MDVVGSSYKDSAARTRVDTSNTCIVCAVQIRTDPFVQIRIDPFAQIRTDPFAQIRTDPFA